MDVKEYLRSVWYAREEIERLSVRIKEMEAQAMKVTASISGMPHGGNSDAQALWSRIADDTNELYTRLNGHYDLVKEVESFIELIPTDKYKAVLKLRYVDCLSWNKVTTRLESAGYYYDTRQIFRIHGAALEEARRIWNTKKEGNTYAADDKP